MRRRGRLGALLLLVAAAMAGLVIRAQASEPNSALRIPKPGTEQPSPGCAFEFGHNICDWGEATLLASWRAYKDLLGEPLTSFDGRCQVYRYGVLCFDPNQPTTWRVEFTNLGLEDLTRQRLPLQPGATIHPAVQAWLVAQRQVNLDIERVIGHPLHEPICPPAAGSCQQHFTKTRFDFPQNAASASQVQHAPLGLLSPNVPLDVATYQSGGTHPLLVAVAGATALAGGGLLLLSRRRRSRRVSAL